MVTILIPARQYIINCAWTKERTLPAIEQFSCSLLLTLEKVLPGELQNFFGLNERERELLIVSMQEKRLATIDLHGFLIPSPLLLSQSGKKDGPMLVEYQEQTERVVFDSLVFSIRTDQNMNHSTFGLPEVPLPTDAHNHDTKVIIEAFGRQYKSYLDIARHSAHEKFRTSLYKVMGCQKGALQQLPIDIEFTYQACEFDEPKKWTNSYERLKKSLNRPVSSDLESHIADYLGNQQIIDSGTNAEEYCCQFDDPILARFANDYRLDYAAWLRARHEKKTGYGSPDTTAIFGPVYQNNNYQAVLNDWVLDSLRHLTETKTELHAMWMLSDVPLWGASAEPLSRFNSELIDILARYAEKNHLVLIHQGESNIDALTYKRRFGNKFPHAIMTEKPMDRVEILLIPGLFGLVQYHGQPNNDSTITVPLGYITRDPERLAILEKMLHNRIGLVEKLKVSWPKESQLKSLLPRNWQRNNSQNEISGTEPKRSTLRLKNKI